MNKQDLKKQLLNVVGPIDFSETPFALLQKFTLAEKDETLRRYLQALQEEVETGYSVHKPSNKLHEAEHDMLCWLIQIYLNNETQPVFKRYLTVVCLFPDCVVDMKLLLSILDYYDIFNKKF